MSWRRFFQRRRRDQELAQEAESYLEHETDEAQARGLSAEEARYAARRKLGNLTLIREEVYERNSVALLESVWRDLRHGLRQLRRTPWFTAAALISLALGIGANTAIFSLVDQVILRMLPVHNPQELVQLRVGPRRFGNNNGDNWRTFSYPLFRAIQQRNTVFSGVTGEVNVLATLSGPESNEIAGVGLVAGNYFDVFGVRAHIGRVLSPGDDRTRNGSPVAVLQHDFWRSHFFGSPRVIGSTIRLNGSPFTVIGVGPAGFGGTDVGSPVRLWVPVTMKPTITPTWDALNDERYSWFSLFGRLKPGVSQERAQAAMQVLYRQRQQEELKGEYFRKFPADREHFLRQTFNLAPAGRGDSGLRHRFERPLILLQWLVGIILLIACANVANLLLARSASREREIAIRAAFGAGRARLVRQLLAECALLAAGGAVAGLVLSTFLGRMLVRMLPGDPANLPLQTTPDARILAFTAAITLLTVFVFGLVPAWRGSRVPPGMTLKEETASASGTASHVRLRKLLVALQVGLASMLLVGAGLFARTLDNLRRVDLGIKTHNVATFRVRPATVYPDARKLQMFRELFQGLAGVPGVKAVGGNRQTLMGGGQWDSDITIPGVAEKRGEAPWSYFNAITPGYFEALGIPVTGGRDLTWHDWESSRKLCLVNRAFLREYLDGANPVGRLMSQDRDVAPDMEIVGVAGDSTYANLREPMLHQVFVSLHTKMAGTSGITVYARIEGDARAALPQLRAQVHRIDPNLVVSDLRTLDDQIDMLLSNERMLSFLSGTLAVLAVLLAGTGLHGVLAFMVARRTREIGIRVALGAERGRVIRMIAQEALTATFAGMGAGLALALACGRYIESLLFGVKAADLPVFLLGAGLLTAVSLTATVIPAWRATRIDPLRALRYQ